MAPISYIINVDSSKVDVKLSNEHCDYKWVGKESSLIDDFIKDKYKCLDSQFNINRKRLIDSFELLRSLSHAYKCNYSVEECRKSFDLNSKQEEIKNAINSMKSNWNSKKW